MDNLQDSVYNCFWTKHGRRKADNELDDGNKKNKTWSEKLEMS